MDLSERGGAHGAHGEASSRHPWEEARARFFLDTLAAAHAVSASSRVLDVGAGDTFVVHRLLERFPTAEVTAWDDAYSDDDLAKPQPSGLTLVRQPPVGTFDLVLMLDVLEHIDDEAPVLEAARAALAPGGRLCVSVPAWPRLFGMHDSRLRHRRRYRPAEVRTLLERHGFVLLEQGGLFHSLLLPRAAEVALAERMGRGSFAAAPLHGHPPLRRVLDLAVRADTLLSRGFARAHLDVPGLSWWALCARSRP